MGSLGLLLTRGINITAGITLACLAYGAQIVVGFLMTSKLSKRDQLHIAFAQQNGITAVILSLLLEPTHPGTVAITAPAIITISVLYGIGNKLVDQIVKRQSMAEYSYDE